LAANALGRSLSGVMTHVSAAPRPTPSDPGLDVLVARTAGPQPWRKVFHAFNATALAVAVVALDPSDGLLLGALAALVVVLLIADLFRLRNVQANRLFFKAFAALASPREARGIASSTWYAIGLLGAFALFSREIGVSSVLVLGLADPLAGYVGRRFGRRPLLGGTLEGTLTFLVIAAVILAARHPAPVALVAAAVSALAERRAWPLDDNLAVPLACGAALTALTWIA
jgi:dolichol kinase